MCLVTRVKARLLALIVVLLALLAQQRTLVPVVHQPVAVARLVAERGEHVQSNAVRSEAALRVVPSALLPGVPVFPAATVPAFSWLEPRLHPELVAALQPAEVARHFHSKRRIPRMNSEEPPRV